MQRRIATVVGGGDGVEGEGGAQQVASDALEAFAVAAVDTGRGVQIHVERLDAKPALEHTRLGGHGGGQRQLSGGVQRRVDVGDVIVAFICNHCPFVKHVRTELAALGRDCETWGVKMVAINSNDWDRYPDDSPAKMKEEAENFGHTFDYVLDETQEVAKAYRAACTPDFFLFDADRKLVYRGQFDDSRPGNGRPVSGGDLRAAVDALIEGHRIAVEQRPSIGCNIKWKPGNEPAE
jgi:hypothetical protein